MATIKEQLEALGVTDDLKREESPLAGNWEGNGSPNTGKATATGWTITASKTNAGAKRKVGLALGSGVLLFFDAAVRPAVGQFFEMGINGKSGFYVKRTGTNACEVGIYTSSSVIKTLGGVTFAAGDRFAISWEASKTVTVWRKPAAGAWVEVTSASGETPSGTAPAEIYFTTASVAGTEGRMTNFAQGAIAAEGKAEKKEVADSVTVTDSAARMVAKVLADAQAVSDTLVKKAIKMLADSTGVSDASQKLVGKATTDSATTTDSTQLQRILAVVLNDAVSLADSTIKKVAKVLGDTTAANDSTSLGVKKHLADGVQAQDSLSKRIVKQLADAIHVKDAVSIPQLVGTWIRYLGKWVKVK